MSDQNARSQTPEPFELEWLRPAGRPVPRETAVELINRYSAQSPFAAQGYEAGQVFETTEDLYTHFLEAVPPLMMTSGSFACGEMTPDRLVDSYHLINGRAFCVTIEWAGRKSLAQAWSALITFLEETRS